MKKVLLTAVFLSSFSVFSQVKLMDKVTKRVSAVNNAYIELHEKTRYDLFFKNMNTDTHEFVKFSFRAGKTSDYNDIFNLIIKGFETAVTEEVLKVSTNNEIVGIKYINQNGERVVQLLKYEGQKISMSALFTIDEIKELFKK